jgi:hypothetical protein
VNSQSQRTGLLSVFLLLSCYVYLVSFIYLPVVGKARSAASFRFSLLLSVVHVPVMLGRHGTEYEELADQFMGQSECVDCRVLFS